ncbi:DUF4280 domain-containing protein [Paenibacillus thiaminolyticus]|uniref:DUF4280 domain-containing protein n=1 Tax=Paenibacillus thiaminolyticus TaxID=49283 RepID=A0A3A3GH77_PANTH|nr:DUF4280 domain-containing protein [Paenibacillus thiaminolyticus]RJG21434.1 DUF4280 domain-containing protein [Paenibacillus thiaminolyticus]
MLQGLLLSLASGLFSGEHSYVVRGATVTCSKGTDPGVLNLPEDHGVYIKGEPLMNIADHFPGEHIGCFGFCETSGGLCVPQIYEKWTGGKRDVLIDNEPALLSNSKLSCTSKGIISIEQDGQK